MVASSNCFICPQTDRDDPADMAPVVDRVPRNSLSPINVDRPPTKKSANVDRLSPTLRYPCSDACPHRLESPATDRSEPNVANEWTETELPKLMCDATESLNMVGTRSVSETETVDPNDPIPLTNKSSPASTDPCTLRTEHRMTVSLTDTLDRSQHPR